MSITQVKSIILFLIAIFIASADGVFSQDFEEWKKQKEEQYQQFKDERDAEFLKMLQDAWEEMEAYNSGDNFKEPKPKIIPKADNNLNQKRDPYFKSGTVQPDLSELNDKANELVDRLAIRKTSDSPSGTLKNSLNYYNVEIEYFHQQETIRLKGQPSQQTLSDYWADMSAMSYELIVNRIKEIQEQLNLNDWGTLLVVHQFGKDLYPVFSNNRSLFVWFIMTKLGYDVKVGYNRDHIFIMMPSNRKWYNTQFLNFKGIRYYVIQLDKNVKKISSLRTYKGSYPDSNEVLSLDLNKMPRLPIIRKTREFSFNWQGVQHRFSVILNENVVKYYEYFPNTELGVYINAVPNKSTSNLLLKHMADIITGKSQLEAVNIILHFVQTGFEYQTDDEQFGRQKYMLPDEILYYPYSDCDDRTILFTFLTKELLDIDVIGLRYPNHIATAVKLDNFTGGDYVTVEGERYTIADPTYINATLGMTMRKFRNHSPELVSF